jgi:hypothetical protein
MMRDGKNVLVINTISCGDLPDHRREATCIDFLTHRCQYAALRALESAYMHLACDVPVNDEASQPRYTH